MWGRDIAIAGCGPAGLASALLLARDGHRVTLTFGLLSPNKGIEVMIEALHRLVKDHPDLVYIVLGATHPHLAAREGERYRDELASRVRRLGLESHVRFVNEYVDAPTLQAWLSACDIYVTPYLSEAQITSGTLAYAVGLGKAVISTPYWHAQELLAGRRGQLVPHVRHPVSLPCALTTGWRRTAG